MSSPWLLLLVLLSTVSLSSLVAAGSGGPVLLSDQTSYILPEAGQLERRTFTCEGRETGYYSDPDSDCQLHHLCTLNDGAEEDSETASKIRHQTFSCRAGERFSFEEMECQNWSSTTCRHEFKAVTGSNREPRQAFKTWYQLPAAQSAHRNTVVVPQEDDDAKNVFYLSGRSHVTELSCFTCCKPKELPRPPPRPTARPPYYTTTTTRRPQGNLPISQIQIISAKDRGNTRTSGGSWWEESRAKWRPAKPYAASKAGASNSP